MLSKNANVNFYLIFFQVIHILREREKETFIIDVLEL